MTYWEAGNNSKFLMNILHVKKTLSSKLGAHKIRYKAVPAGRESIHNGGVDTIRRNCLNKAMLYLYRISKRE